MKKENTVSQDWISISDAANYLGVSKDTLRRWEKKGKITSNRTVGSHRRYLKSELQTFFTNIPKVTIQPTPQKQISPKPQPPTLAPHSQITTIKPTSYLSSNSQQTSKSSFKGILITLSLATIIIILLISSILLYMNIQNQKTPSEPLSPVATNK